MIFCTQPHVEHCQGVLHFLAVLKQVAPLPVEALNSGAGCWAFHWFHSVIAERWWELGGGVGHQVQSFAHRWRWSNSISLLSVLSDLSVLSVLSVLSFLSALSVLSVVEWLSLGWGLLNCCYS